jgi:glutaredoxin
VFKKVLFLGLLFTTVYGNSQEKKIKIITEDIPNRIAFYAINENEQDLDVMFTLSGTNFRQSSARPRYIRVPATSKVHMKTIVLIRGKSPSYTYELKVNDSLSTRALVKESEQIKIRPPKQITVYVPDKCEQCDSLVIPLSESKYLFNLIKLDEKPELQEQLQVAFGKETPIDSLNIPIVNLAGKLYTNLITYQLLIEQMYKE